MLTDRYKETWCVACDATPVFAVRVINRNKYSCCPACILDSNEVFLEKVKNLKNTENEKRVPITA